MALSKVLKFDWEGLLSKVESADVKRSLNVMRGKANEIAASSSKFVKTPEPIDFAAYKKKLRFSAAAVDALEAAYKSRKVPTYSASLPAFEAQKRATILTIIKSTKDAASADLVHLKSEVSRFEAAKITGETYVSEVEDRFPGAAKVVEKEIQKHEWFKEVHH